MPQYLIKQDNPFTYKSQILKFWQEYLTDTPPQRLEWMMNGNPAGPSTWFFAFEQNSCELVGMISLTPRELMANGSKIRAGILGDVVVDKKHRVSGPALNLVKKALNAMDSMNLSLIYSIPNPYSEKLFTRSGLHIIGQFLHLVRPIDFHYYQKKYINRLSSILPSSAMESVLKILSRDTYSSDSGIHEQKMIDEEFNTLWKNYQIPPEVIIGVRGCEYIQWKFIDNPLSSFHVISSIDKKTNRLFGYLAYRIADKQMHIYDLFAEKDAFTFGLLKRVAKIAQKNNCIGIYVRLSEMTPMIKVFKKCNYFDAMDRAPIFVKFKEELNLDHWEFFSGDRNI